MPDSLEVAGGGGIGSRPFRSTYAQPHDQTRHHINRRLRRVGGHARTTVRVPESAESRPGRHVSRHRCRRSVPVDGGRQRCRHRGLGRGGKQVDVRVPRKDSLQKTAHRPGGRPQQLREGVGAVAEGPVRVLQEERGAAEAERPLRPEGHAGSAGGPDRSQHVVGRWDDPADDLRAVRGTRSMRSMEFRRAAPTGRNSRSWSSPRERR